MEVTLGVSDLTLFWFQPPPSQTIIPRSSLSAAFLMLLSSKQVSALWGMFGTHTDVSIRIL